MVYFEIASNAHNHIFHSVSCSFFGISNFNSISMVYWITFNNRRICCVSHINSKSPNKGTFTRRIDENSLFYKFISSKRFLGWCDLAIQNFAWYYLLIYKFVKIIFANTNTNYIF